MGAVASKQECEDAEDQGAGVEAEKLSSEAVSTPRSSRESLNQPNLDPRSPSKRFARTPVELLNAVVEKLGTLTIETRTAAAETPLRRHVILPVDPRSPSVEVQRTPIVVSASKNEQFPEEIRNKNLEKVKIRDLLNSPVPASECFAKHVPPKLLSSCTVTPKLKVDSYKRKSLILLETNVDYTETDLDVVIREKCLSVYSKCESPRSPSNHSFSGAVPEPHDAIQNEAAPVEDRLDVSVESNSELEEPVATTEEPASEPTSLDSLELEEEDPKLSPSSVEAQSSSPPLTELVSKSAPASPPHIVSLTPKTPKAHSTSPVRSLSAEVLEFQKKLTNLIYEDEDPIVWPRAVKPRNQIRAPLGVRNGNGAVQKLKVSDKPRKTMSRIPVFKEKRIKVQCENTPPKSMRSLKQPRKHAWDPKDETLFI
ncbi:hypothetical protein HUJ04_005738 [Dendroctonus ponderosae]|uniref:Uncharacterized protein n=1 Tax=Dendroctonus ponderosae TaxID=77166 RepID=A0AAR5P659_DENPD|nr:hypothetical protein HUJ04_005738 [Dendroctonus ponderosae]KAH1004729.1 hypothetical protein HUJ05_005511 [Dendroctonus ponderosae]